MTTHTEPEVSDELRANLLAPFIDAAQYTFFQMAQIDLSLERTYVRSDFRTFGDVSAVIGLASPAEGSLVLSFTEKAARTLAGRILGAANLAPDDDLVRDCIGEIANVVAGQAKGALSGTAFYFAYSPPTVVAGRGHEIRHRPGVACNVVEFTTNVGEIQLQLSFSARVEA